MLILWLGQSAPPSLYAQVFGIQGVPQDTSGEWANGQAWWGEIVWGGWQCRAVLFWLSP